MMMKNTRPIRLWDSNPLVLAYQANSLTISELQLRVFQNGRNGGIRTHDLRFPKPARKPGSATFREISKTRLTFEFKKFGFKFAVCVFQMVDHKGVQPFLEQCKCSVLSDITNGP